MTHIEQIAEARGLSQMVPELRNLLGQLKMGNLTDAELDELEKQLAGNAGAGQPRENTERPPPVPESAEPGGSSGEHEDSGFGNGKTRGHRHKTGGGKLTKLTKFICLCLGKPVNEQRERASHRNLEALLRGLHSSEALTDSDDRVTAEESLDAQPSAEELVDGQHDPILRKIVDFNRPPVILSLERPGVRSY